MNLPPLCLSGGSVGGNGWWSGGGGSVQGNYTTAVQARVCPLTVVIVTPPRKNKAGRSERRTVEQRCVGGGKGSPPTAAPLIASAGSGLSFSPSPSLPLFPLRPSFSVLGVVRADQAHPAPGDSGPAKLPDRRRNRCSRPS